MRARVLMTALAVVLLGCPPDESNCRAQWGDCTDMCDEHDPCWNRCATELDRCERLTLD